MSHSIEQRFWQKVNKNGPLPENLPQLGQCWLWLGWDNGKGYGKFDFGNKKIYAHRFSYQISIGEIPQGLVLDHLCRNRICVNPNHLEPKTNKQNLLATGSKIRNNGKLQREKTHCLMGHEFNEENTYLTKTKQRHCRKCRAARERKRRELCRILPS